MPSSTEEFSLEPTETSHLESGFDWPSTTTSKRLSEEDGAIKSDSNTITTESDLPSANTASSTGGAIKPKFGKSEVVGTSVGGTCVFALIIAGVYLFLRRRKRRQKARVTVPECWDPAYGLGGKSELEGSTMIEHHCELGTDGEFGGTRAAELKGGGFPNQSSPVPAHADADLLHSGNVGELRPRYYGTESYNPNRDTISTCSPVMSVISPTQQSPTVVSPILRASTRPGSANEERMTSPISELEGCLPEIYEK
ncbi:hypothetical protein IQ07DRAFT_605484 [Pyrenochaeta sp. DS3sAY3a]|nr:hypothetical protein IQ07DRAFT_605484 [Pyrenochaeta sp. DS3sAY3a]